MRRSVPLAFVLALVLASPAFAVHHLMRVEEVAPGGSQADQFIELRDPAGEQFPLPQYSVAATDAAGAVISGASQGVDPSPFRFSTARFVVGGSNVAPRDTALSFTIPPEAARVCFYAEGNPPSGTPINCLVYGGAAAIPAGQSAQRQSCDSVAAAAPTPGGPNTETGACGGGGTTPGGGGGGGGTGGGGGGGATDLTPPQQQLAGRRRQDVDRLAVAVMLNENGSVTVRGRVTVPGAARVLRFKPVTRSVAANTRVRFRLRLTRKARRAVKAALHDGRRLKARVSVAAVDAAGNLSTAKRAIRLTD